MKKYVLVKLFLSVTPSVYDYDAYDGVIIYIMTSISLYYISLSLGFGNIDDRHRHPNINIREIIWLGD